MHEDLNGDYTNLDVRHLIILVFFGSESGIFHFDDALGFYEELSILKIKFFAVLQ